MSFQQHKIDQVDQYIEKQATLDTLRFITCGSVDDGKSTLIGRLLYEAQMIFDDQIIALKNDSKNNPVESSNINFALLVDGLASEREQGITIDVAYRFFSTDRRKFIVADTPGHEQYTRNMVTGASTADAAVILIDARQGVVKQTRRHSIICSKLGIKNIILAINKMDLIDYSESLFSKIDLNYKQFSKNLNFKSITSIPISALIGDNILKRSKKTEWFQGPTLVSFLETVDTRKSLLKYPFRLPIQWVNRPNDKFRGFSGTVEAGKAEIGQSIRVLPSGETANLKDIILYKDKLNKTEVGQAITVTLDREVDVSRGDVIISSDDSLEISDQFEIEIIWMDQDPGYSGRSYLLKIGTSLVNAQITNIKCKININNLEKLSTNKLELNDLGIITLKTNKPITFEKYQDCSGMGSLILIDRLNNRTVAAGMIKFVLRRAKNIHKYKLDIDKSARHILNGHTSKVLWLTGLSGSGKSTIANAIEKALFNRGVRTYVLDGDNVRHGLNKDLGFRDADRVENIRRISEVAKLMVDAGILVITSFISPFRAERQMARDMFDKGDFIEIFVDTPIEVAEQRDPKGLYKKARKGELPNFTGIDSPYEKPEKPEILVSTNTETLENIVKNIISRIGI